MRRARASRLASGASILLAAVLLWFAGPVYAFHSGGVAQCEGCHSVHNSSEGAPVVGTMPQYTSGQYLLKGQDSSSTCLNCHLASDTSPTSYHIASANVAPYDSTSPIEMTPGGDFAWLKKTMTGSVSGVPTTWDGDRHGHNVVSFDYGFTPDQVLALAPGGTYPASALACISCHDPHGQYRRFADGSYAVAGLPISNSGSYGDSGGPVAGVSAVGTYRLLGGVGYQPKSLAGGYAFTANPPDAVAPSNYNRAETSNTDRSLQTTVAYGRNSSEWCQNCHPRIHVDPNDVSATGRPGLVHPAGNAARLSAAITASYNAYVSAGVLTNTGDAFSTLAPYELGTDDYEGVLKPFASGTAAGTWYQAGVGSNVTCLTCHRAHATAFESMTRFSVANDFMTVADAAGAAAYDSSTTENKINVGYSSTQQQNAYYGRPAVVFGPNAKEFCVKCHG